MVSVLTDCFVADSQERPQGATEHLLRSSDDEGSAVVLPVHPFKPPDLHGSGQKPR